jgi:triphosphoribosyl-dephospho-CoA synthase
VTAATQQATYLIPRCVADHVAAASGAALLAELETWPKPGLVSRLDSGSHTDMDASTFKASAIAIAPFFGQLAVAGAAGADMDRLREIGVQAERAMLAATGGVNKPWDECAAPIWRGRCAGTGSSRLSDSTRDRLPALRCGRSLAPEDPEAARVQSFFAILASMEDTNLLHRGGAAGLRYAQEEAAGFLRLGGVEQAYWRVRATASGSSRPVPASIAAARRAARSRTYAGYLRCDQSGARCLHRDCQRSRPAGGRRYERGTRCLNP